MNLIRFLYFGGQLEAYKTNAYYNSYETEASLVDECLLTERRDKSYTDGSLGYWPTYISLSPQARGAYLDWLFGRDLILKLLLAMFLFIFMS
jgi:hypothetical protein